MAEEGLDIALKNANDYYIHLNKANVGNRIQGEDAATLIFKSHQFQSLQDAAIQTYQEKFLASTNLAQGAESLGLGLVLQDDFIPKLDEELKKALQNEVNIEKMTALREIWNDFGYVANAKKILNQDKMEESAKALSILFQNIEKSVKLFGGKDSIYLCSLISDAITEGELDYKRVGSILEEKLKIFNITNNGNLVRADSLKRVAGYLDNLAYAFHHGVYKSKLSSSETNEITATGIARIISQNLISTGFGEGLSFLVTQKANQVADDTIRVMTAKNVKVGGTGTVKTDLSDSEVVTQKADASVSGVKISSQIIDKKNAGFDFNMNIGFSVKFYSTQNFYGMKNGEEKIFTGNGQFAKIGSGSGGPLTEAIFAIWNQDEERYLVYNYLIHDIQNEKIKKMLLMRNFIRLWASAGKEDFAQFLFVNGKLLSVWEIIRYCYLINEGSSGIEGFNLSINGLNAARNANKKDSTSNDSWIKAWDRSHNVNEKLNSATISSKMHLEEVVKKIPASIS